MPFRIIPGITAGIGGLAYAAIPATTRDTNNAVILATGHLAKGEGQRDWAALARTGLPIILYMGMTHLETIAAGLIAGGLEPETPVAIVADATTPRAARARNDARHRAGRRGPRRLHVAGHHRGGFDRRVTTRSGRGLDRGLAMRAGAAVPGLLIAAARSGSGKTVLTLGLMRALGRRGLRVAGRKNGPDYIDPAFHAAVTGRPSYNLDSWAMPADLLRGLAVADPAETDLVLCEGSMGLFDGVPAGPGQGGSSADIAALTGWPVVLVHDCSGQSQSAAALLMGCAAYDPRIRIAGVILNRIASERHRRLVSDAVARTGLTIFGAVPRSESLVLPERHLGLVQAGETGDLEARVDAAADVVAAHVDLDALLAAAAAPGLSGPDPRRSRRLGAIRPSVLPASGSRWRAMPPSRSSTRTCSRAGGVPGPRSWFSPLDDEPPPDDCDACWLPGGYPELHAARIANAATFMDGLRAFARERPVHGECGGYMVLGRSLVDAAGGVHLMAGLLDVETSFARRKLHLGYRLASLLADGPLGPAGTRLSGHEFHYATITSNGQDPAFASVVDAYGSEPAASGSRHGNVTGSFFHVLSER